MAGIQNFDKIGKGDARSEFLKVDQQCAVIIRHRQITAQRPGVAIDGAMVVASMLLEMDPPRLAQGMAEKFIGKVPEILKGTRT